MFLSASVMSENAKCLENRKYKSLGKKTTKKQLDSMESPHQDGEMCVCTHIWLIACLCLYVHLRYSVIIYFQFHLSCFFPHSFPSFRLLRSSSLLLFPSLFCKLGALARRRISLFGKGWCLFLHTLLCLFCL